MTRNNFWPSRVDACQGELIQAPMVVESHSLAFSASQGASKGDRTGHPVETLDGQADVNQGQRIYAWDGADITGHLAVHDEDAVALRVLAVGLQTQLLRERVDACVTFAQPRTPHVDAGAVRQDTREDLAANAIPRFEHGDGLAALLEFVGRREPCEAGTDDAYVCLNPVHCDRPLARLL